MNTSKWLPKQHIEVVKLFEQTRALEREFKILGKKFATDINLDLPDYYVSDRLFFKKNYNILRFSLNIKEIMKNRYIFSLAQIYTIHYYSSIE